MKKNLASNGVWRKNPALTWTEKNNLLEKSLPAPPPYEIVAPLAHGFIVSNWNDTAEWLFVWVCIRLFLYYFCPNSPRRWAVGACRKFLRKHYTEVFHPRDNAQGNRETPRTSKRRVHVKVHCVRCGLDKILSLCGSNLTTAFGV